MIVLLRVIGELALGSCLSLRSQACKPGCALAMKGHLSMIVEASSASAQAPGIPISGSLCEVSYFPG